MPLLLTLYGHRTMAGPTLQLLSYSSLKQNLALLRKSDTNRYHWICMWHIHARSFMRSKHAKKLRFDACFKHSLKWLSIASVKYIQNACYINIKNETRGFGHEGLWVAQNNQPQFTEERQEHPLSWLPIHPTSRLLKAFILRRKEWVALFFLF